MLSCLNFNIREGDWDYLIVVSAGQVLALSSDISQELQSIHLASNTYIIISDSLRGRRTKGREGGS